MIKVAYTQKGLLKILKEAGYSHPLLPMAVGILLEAYESGEAPLVGTPLEVLNPVGMLVTAASPKRKRKASKYNLEYKKQYAILKKKHPRTSFAGLAKKAHKATKKVMK